MSGVDTGGSAQEVVTLMDSDIRGPVFGGSSMGCAHHGELHPSDGESAGRARRTTLQIEGGSMSQRARALADRIEEGAAGLAAYVEGLSEAEWRAPLSEKGTDRRSIGVIVHHVASVYPIEVDLARAIASGKAVTDEHWEVVAEVERQSRQGAVRSSKVGGAGTSKAEQPRGGPAAVRTFTDEELDQGRAVLIELRRAGHSAVCNRRSCHAAQLAPPGRHPQSPGAVTFELRSITHDSRVKSTRLDLSRGLLRRQRRKSLRHSWEVLAERGR